VRDALDIFGTVLLIISIILIVRQPGLRAGTGSGPGVLSPYD